MPGATHQIVLTVNGPGEISSWLTPVVETLARRSSTLRICAAVLPSVFRSGLECSVLKGMAHLDAVADKNDVLACILRGRMPPGFRDDLPGRVLHFGGEPMLSKLLALRLRYPLLFYGEELPRWPAMYRRIFTADAATGTGGRRTRIGVPVGNLMVDAAKMRTPRRRRRNRRLTIGIFPGSRYYQAKHMLPFLLQTARCFTASHPEVRWLLARADFMPLDTLEEIARAEEGRCLPGDSAVLKPGRRRPALLSDAGVLFEIQSPASVMARADFALTIPGTNTAELAALGVPMIVLLPTQRADLLPLPGPAGHLHHLPLVGRHLKVFLLWLFWKRVKYLALPNRRLRKEVVPEMVGKITPCQVAHRLNAFVRTPPDALLEDLEGAMGAGGAARKIVEDVLCDLRWSKGDT